MDYIYKVKAMAKKIKYDGLEIKETEKLLQDLVDIRKDLLNKLFRYLYAHKELLKDSIYKQMYENIRYAFAENMFYTIKGSTILQCMEKFEFETYVYVINYAKLVEQNKELVEKFYKYYIENPYRIEKLRTF